ncbi:MAG TPA: divalent cation transporter [Thermoplasmata archaeon]|nr:divalent cation transporter [Thermoplasmata archaeon]
MQIKNAVKESLPFLILCGLGEIFAGSIFGSMHSFMESIPSLIVLIPPIIGLRGNINATLGSRLTSAAHMGLIDFKTLGNDELKENIKSSLILSFLMSVFAGVLAHSTTLMLGLQSAGILKLVGIALLAGTTSGVLLAFLTLFIVSFSFKRGWDPDNITGPALSTLGDIFTMLCIFGSALLIGGM